MSRKYTKLKDKIDIALFKMDIESGLFNHNDIKSKYNLNARQLRYLMQKHDIQNNLQIDRSFTQTEEYKEKISQANRGKVRTKEHKENYSKGTLKRKIKNNRGFGWKHSQETIIKIQSSNIKTYSELPEKWRKACIENDEWFQKLRERAENKSPKTEQHIRKIVESKTNMTYEEWQTVRGEFDAYCAKVRNITNQQPLHTLENIDKRGKEYHLDHMFSICEGFKQNILPEIIGNIINLVILSSTDNCSKNKKCSITVETLMEKYNAHNGTQK